MNHYQMYEMAHLALTPARAFSELTRLSFKNPMNPMTYTGFGRNLAASAELFERLTRRYRKPVFGLHGTAVGGRDVPVHERVVWERPFCRILHFRRDVVLPRPQPRLLIIAPLSGHYATLLRGTVAAFLPTHEVYITDWADARTIPMSVRFDLDDYVDYLIDIFQALAEDPFGDGLHALAVCQPSVPLLAAVALIEADQRPFGPTSMTLMSGPVDTRRNPTAVNMLAEKRGTDWFRRHCIGTVPFPQAGVGRQVYPGFLQLCGFVALNFDRHVNAHLEMLNHLVQGDGDSAEKHREFYDEYMAVMDLTAEYYLQTIDTVFVRHALPKGEMMHRGRNIELRAIRGPALMTVEGEKDDITGIGQTAAAQELCSSIPGSRKLHHMQRGVGHYGVFNGSRFRSEIAPRIDDFIAHVAQPAAAVGYSKAQDARSFAEPTKLKLPLRAAFLRCGAILRIARDGLLGRIALPISRHQFGDAIRGSPA